MIFMQEWLEAEKLKSFLQKSFLEFNVTQPSIQESIFRKYSIDLDKNKLAGLELFEDDNLVASAIISYQEFYSNCGPLKLSFLTQVIVQPQYRGRGHLGKLIEFAKEVDEKNESLASIVIARKKVGNLYSKYGYIGFGVFPNITIEKHHGEELLSASASVDWEIVSVAYEKTYQNILGGIYRSNEYWNYLKLEVESGRYSLGTIRLREELGYFLFSNDECFEIASTSNALYSELIELSGHLGVRKFRIGSNHPSYQVLKVEGGVYSVRPEREEGHMLKPYKGGEFLRAEIEMHMSRTLQTNNDEEKFSIDISLPNEW
jgi:predicted acetyltransferase